MSENAAPRVLDETYVYGPEKFGEGAYGCVWKAKDRSGVRFAIKQIEKEKLKDQKDLEHLERELKYQYCLCHDGLVKLDRVYVTDSSYFLVMQPVVGETLLDIISRGAIREDHARMYFQQLLDAVSYMHTNGVAHRDLQLENIIITDDNKLKVCDFGLAVEFVGEGGSVTRTTHIGSLRYMAPELFQDPNYQADKVDIWAMGVILYAMCTGEFPFDDTDPDLLKSKIFRTEPNYPDHFPPELAILLQDMLTKDGGERPGVEAVADYPWVRRQYERNLGDEMVAWSDENLRIVDEPEIRTITPLTVFALVGAVHPLRLEPAAWSKCQNLCPVSFFCNQSDQGARRAIREWVKHDYGDNASLEEKALSMKLTVTTDESEELGFTITTCELSGVHTIISIQLHAGNPEYMEALQNSFERYLQHN